MGILHVNLFGFSEKVAYCDLGNIVSHMLSHLYHCPKMVAFIGNAATSEQKQDNILELKRQRFVSMLNIVSYYL